MEVHHSHSADPDPSTNSGHRGRKKWTHYFWEFLMLFLTLLIQTSILAQVQVSKEPLHKNVLENKYIRLLDVWMQPGDTSLFHIHSTPSVFLYFSSTNYVSQIKGAVWVKDKSVAGFSWYRSFFRDTLIHRVGNCDTVPFHVTDVEILSSYDTLSWKQALPFTVLFENERVVAYKLTNSSFNKQIIKDRGPMIAELVSGEGVILNNAKGKELFKIKNGKYLYIKPGTSFYFSVLGKEEINMVLFEIK